MSPNEVISRETKELENLLHYSNRPVQNPNLLANAIRTLRNFITIDPTNPDGLSFRVSRLKAATSKLRAMQDDRECIASAMSNIQEQESYLSDLLDFYKKNSSRIHKSAPKAEGFSKPFTKSGRELKYGLSKGLPDTNPPNVSGPTSFEERMVRGYKRELYIRGVQSGRSTYSNYATWLDSQNGRYQDKTTAYTVTKYLLEENLLAKKKTGEGKHEPFDWSLAEDVTDALPDHQLRFIGGLVFAVYSIDNNNRAYPGTHPGIYTQVYPLHTLMSDKVEIGTQTVTFMGRTVGTQDRDKMEMYNSFKYIMRHDNLFLEIHPHKSEKSHAEASDFKSVQAAGALVAQRGKVVAIDNMSGHFRPGWRLLKQAVEKTSAKGAFARHALVGVSYKKEVWYFPVGTFLALANASFDVGRMNEEANKDNWGIPQTLPQSRLTEQFEEGKWTKQTNRNEFADFSSTMKKKEI